MEGKVELFPEIVKKVRAFIIESFLFEDDGHLTEDESFLENGVIDSTGVLELIAFIEGEFGIKVADSEIVPENLDSLRSVSNFIDRKLSASAPLN